MTRKKARMSDKFKHFLGTQPESLIKALSGEGGVVEDKQGNRYSYKNTPRGIVRYQIKED